MRPAPFAALSVALLSALAPSSAPQFDSRHLQGLGDTRYHRFVVSGRERPYHVYVRLPESYVQEPERSYPAVYLLDGGLTFPLLAAYYRYLVLGQEIPEAIVVGISYGTDDPEQGNDRSHDFTAPAPDRDYWGGAADFQRAFRDGFLPLIEGTYRADAARRVIFGQSLGGQFVLYSALHDPDLFWGHIASNPALHRNLQLFLPGAVAADRATASRLFVASGSADEPRFREPAQAWIDAWTAEGSPPWALETRSLPGQSHFSAAPEAFRQGLIWLFAGP